jgi:hypothetical protein
LLEIVTDLLVQEIQSLDNKIHETVETINTMKIQREFFLSFAKEPQLFINKWIISQSRGRGLAVLQFVYVHNDILSTYLLLLINLPMFQDSSVDFQT